MDGGISPVSSSSLSNNNNVFEDVYNLLVGEWPDWENWLGLEMPVVVPEVWPPPFEPLPGLSHQPPQPLQPLPSPQQGLPSRTPTPPTPLLRRRLQPPPQLLQPPLLPLPQQPQLPQPPPQQPLPQPPSPPAQLPPSPPLPQLQTPPQLQPSPQLQPLPPQQLQPPPPLPQLQSPPQLQPSPQLQPLPSQQLQPPSPLVQLQPPPQLQSIPSQQLQPLLAQLPPSPQQPLSPSPRLFLPRPTVRIIEQPPRRFRFRYASEPRNGGTVNAKIRLENCGTGLEIVVVVSCITKDEPYKAHPNYLFGRKTIQGVYVDTPRNNEFRVFGIGIRRATHRNVREELERRAQLRLPQLNKFDSDLVIDPFNHGFTHAAEISSNDLHKVRLAFQVFIKRTQDFHEEWEALPAVVSDPIYNENAAADTLEIVSLVKPWGISTGGDTVLIEIDQRVDRNDTEVVFYEVDAKGNQLWEKRVPLIYAHQNCFAITTPPCGTVTDVDVEAFVVVLKLSNDHRSNEPHTFTYKPVAQGPTPGPSQAGMEEEEEPRSRLRVQPRARFNSLSDEDESGSDREDLSEFDYSEGLDFFATVIREEEDEEPRSRQRVQSRIMVPSDEDESDIHDSEDESDQSDDSLYEGLAQLFISSNDF